MMIFLFAALSVAGVSFLFWQLMDSDKATAEKLRVKMAEDAGTRSEEPGP